MPSNGWFWLQTTGSYTGLNVEVDNISLIEITDDTDLPRINYTNFDYENGEVVPYSGEGSLLLEPQSTNLVTYSEDLSAWSKFNSTVTESSVLSLDGVNNSYAYERTSGSSSYIYRTVSLSNTTVYTLSFFAKSGTSTNVRTDIWDSTQSTQCKIQVDLATKTVSNFIGTSYKIEDYTNGWMRVSVTFTSESSFDTTYNRYFNADSVGTELYIWGIQLEEQSYATSYIPTEGSIKTRLQDICNNAGNSDLINSTEGVLYAEYEIGGDDSVGYQIISIKNINNSNDNVVGVGKQHNSNDIFIRLTMGGTSIFNNLSATPRSGFNKVAISYKSGDSSAWVNGAKVHISSVNFTPSDKFDKLNLAWSNYDSLAFYGNVRCVAVFKEELSDEELQKLTQV